MTEAGDEQLRQPPVLGVERTNGTAIVRLAGELDLYNADDVRRAFEAVAEAAPERVVVDLGEVEFMDSTALGVLIEAGSRLPDRRAFLLANPGTETRRALEVSGLARHFDIHDSVDAARAAAL